MEFNRLDQRDGSFFHALRGKEGEAGEGVVQKTEAV